MIKKLELSLVVLFALFTQYAIGQTQGDTWAKVKANGGGTISLAYVETPGFVYKGSDGNLTGICVDIMKDFVNYVNVKEGVKVNMKFVGDGSSFSKMYATAKTGNGGVFGLGNITITEARKEEIKFSPKFITNIAILLSHSSAPTIKNMNEITDKFSGMKAYTAKGTLNEKRILDIKSKYYPSLEISYASSSPETLQKVISDPKSFTYLDIAFYLDALKNKQPVKRHAIGDKASEEFGIVMPKNTDWDGLMNEFFVANGGYTNSVEYRKILNQHLGATGVKLIGSLK